MLGLLLTSLAATGAAIDPQACGRLAGRSGDIEVTSAEIVGGSAGWRPQGGPGGMRAPAATRPLCRVQGRIEGSIGFELWLPAAGWNGRLLGTGVGGDAGVFNYGDMSRRLNEGFATFSTDSGHKASDARWMASAKKRIDYEHRATHLTTVGAKALAERFYGQAAEHSYFLGCSGGGRQGLKEMQKYPADFDGIAVGAPGPYMPLVSIRMMWFSLMQKHQPAAALTDADWSLYETAVTKACDGKDGVTDGIVENPLACAFPVSRLACREGAGNACLAPAKLAMLQAIVSPMPDEQGKPMDKGLLPGVRTRPGPPSPLLRAMWADAVHDDPQWDEDSFRRTADLEAVNRAMPDLRADGTAIAPFIARGGKAIIYQGWQDPSVIATPTIDYYRALAAANGGVAKLRDHVRLMMVPGMYHCGGGSGADQFGGSGQPSFPGDAQRDILWATIRWVEEGRVPDDLTAARAGTTSLTPVTRRICAFPASARPLPGRDHASATGFACEADPLLAGAR